ncbi:hypothetical protein SLS54_010149 [Diplodia seriata]
MQDRMSERAVLEAFDDLAERHFIVYGETEAVLYADDGFPFQFRICPALARKPQLQDAPDDNKPTRTFGPGSDLEFADDKLLLCTINETHHLVLNKFCVFRPQYVLLTADSFRRQDEPLSLADFDAVVAAWNRLSGSHYALYNCMEAAGSSRVHKHLQLFTHPADFTLFPDRPDAHAAKIPFRYFLRRFGSATPSAQLLLDAYNSLLAEAKQALGVSVEASACPHNVVLVKEWMLVIPRRRSNVDGASANGAGMMGMVWVTDEERLQQWKALGPAWILSQLGVACDEATS